MISDKLSASLERHFQVIDKIILSRQDPITGLLPASTAVNAHGDYTDAWVRDNVYSIFGVWGLSLSYQKYDRNHHRSFLLSQSVVKLMRGILLAMMRQSDRVEAFKYTLNPTNALHAKYGTKTGLAVVGDDEWGHLQLDATSLFLLMITQMTASGLRLIYTMDEVNFIQNLVHYISRAYCVPDYGIWERGNKINHGTTEINGSSVGMAKAALEAMNGFNLFGNVSSQEAVIHVFLSDVARSRFTLESLLPRESISKETDAALLSIIGYPAYAVEDEKLVKRTRDKIIKKLAGNYGCKRFLLDGHQSSIEDESRLHYEPSELRAFEDIESEWPLFFTYLLLDALMREDSEAVEHWREKLKPLFVDLDGQQLLPELYIVPEELIDAEKENPGSQKRVPNENVPLVWAQSLYMLSDMILDGLLRPSDIDPLRRRERIGHQRSTHPLVAVLAENDSVKQRLLDLGFESETISEVKPLKIMHASTLSEVHTLLGKNEKLSLTGAPLLVARTMTTARLHLLSGEEIIFLPYYFNPQGFYFSYDNTLLVSQFRGSLKFLAQNWDQVGQPLVTFLVREAMLLESDNSAMLSLLHDFQIKMCNSVEITTGRLSQLLTTASVERINNLHGFTFKDMELHSASDGFCTSEKEREIMPPLSENALQELEDQDDGTLAYTLQESSNRRVQAYALGLLWKRHGAEFEIFVHDEKFPLYMLTRRLYEVATACHDWAVIRRIADITGRYDDRLEDVLLDIVIGQNRLVVGQVYNVNATISKPMETIALVKIIAEFCSDNTAEKALTQEIILHLGSLIRTNPEFFENTLTLRTWYFVQLLVGQISRQTGMSVDDSYEFLLGLAPHEIYNRLHTVLKSLTDTVTDKKIDTIQIDDWAFWRKESGMFSRFSSKFYKAIWYMLQQCEGIVIGDKHNVKNRMNSELTLDVTAGERSFELRIDDLLQSISESDYRHLNIELIESLARVFRENPKMHVDSDLILDDLMVQAVRVSWKNGNYEEQSKEAWDSFYTLSPKETDKAFVEAFHSILAI